MGREIRRVPKGWEHPRNERGNYQPLHDYSYEEKAAEWMQNYALWVEGKHPDQVNDPKASRYYWEEDMPPDEDTCRPFWLEETRTCFQIYETVSEGTPVSPVFETKDALIDWLTGQGYSSAAARAFASTGWAPSMVLAGGRLFKDIESLSLPREER